MFSAGVLDGRIRRFLFHGLVELELVALGTYLQSTATSTGRMSCVASFIDTLFIPLSCKRSPYIKTAMAATIPRPAIYVARIVLTFELFLGGQCRITPALTPALYQRAMAKAEGTRRHLSFIPINDPEQHTRFIGAMMCLAGALLCTKTTRLMGALLSVSLSLAGVYSFHRMGIPYWLPSVNTVLAIMIIFGEERTR